MRRSGPCENIDQAGTLVALDHVEGGVGHEAVRRRVEAPRSCRGRRRRPCRRWRTPWSRPAPDPVPPRSARSRASPAVVRHRRRRRHGAASAVRTTACPPTASRPPTGAGCAPGPRCRPHGPRSPSGRWSTTSEASPSASPTQRRCGSIRDVVTTNVPNDRFVDSTIGLGDGAVDAIEAVAGREQQLRRILPSGSSNSANAQHWLATPVTLSSSGGPVARGAMYCTPWPWAMYRRPLCRRRSPAAARRPCSGPKRENGDCASTRASPTPSASHSPPSRSGIT